jgi:bacillithiol biosynthesis cysteine-adding enzyme BshC
MADVLYNPDRVARFYRHHLRTLDAYRASAAEIRFNPQKREALIHALRACNPETPALTKLADSGTVAVVTGQQAGLFGGPALTVYKALHAVKLAAHLSAEGIPAVPVFWRATEDHDFAEVNHTWVFAADHLPCKLSIAAASNGRPVGTIPVEAPPLDALRAALSELPFGEEAAAMVADCYSPGSTMGSGFGALLSRILAQFDVLQIDPMLPEFRRLASPALEAAVANASSLTGEVMARNKELAAAGYHAQVLVEENTSFVFLLDGGKRIALKRVGDDYSGAGRRYTSAELAARAEDLSPNALLRPVVQDSMLPTVAYIGGPAEIAYFAQSEAIYRILLGRMPVATPRTGFTILDQRSARRMEKYGLSLPDFFHGEDALREKIAARLTPRDLVSTMDDARHSVDSALERVRRRFQEFDPTLEKALSLSERKIRHQFARLEAKAGREMLRRDERAKGDEGSLYGLAYPERHLQERLYSILPFLAAHGLDLPGQLYGAIELECPDHRLMVV